MSYLVLARKYRPTTFDHLIGQEHVARTLKNAIALDRVAHAYLFAGPRGVGKTTAARLMAMALSCQCEDKTARPCGVCENCLEIQNGQSIDVIEVDGASNRGINEIRELRETVNYMPSKGRYKIYIIDEVHALTKDAFNALLKTLEEPPSHVVFIFATTEIKKVLPTILSRCQRHEFRRITVKDIAERLAYVASTENIPFTNAAMELIASQADGGLRDSLSLLDQVIASGDGRVEVEDVEKALGLIDQDTIRGVLLPTLGGNIAGALEKIDHAYQSGYDFKDLGQKVLEFLRYLVLIKVSAELSEIMGLSKEETDGLKELSNKFSLETLNRHFDAWLKFQNELVRHSHPRWLMEAHVIRLSQFNQLIPLVELSAQFKNFITDNEFSENSNIEATEDKVKKKIKISGSINNQDDKTLNNELNSYTEEHEAESFDSSSHEEFIGAYDDNIKLDALKNEDESIKNEFLDIDEPLNKTSSLNKQKIKFNNWEDFFKAYSSKLDKTTNVTLTGAICQAFSKEKITLFFPGYKKFGNIARSSLEFQLKPFLLENFGQLPILECLADKESIVLEESVVDEAQIFKVSEERLEAFKQTPEAKILTERLAGTFIQYKLYDDIDLKNEDNDYIEDNDE